MTNQIQKDRNRQLFIDAAKDIVLKEGVRELSVRKIAQFTGFSYATIYNYFENLDHLLWHVVMSFIEEMIGSFAGHLNKQKFTPDDLKKVYEIYIRYFTENPNVFQLFFFSQTGEPPEEYKNQLDEPELGMPLEKILKEFAKDGIVKKKDVKILSDIISSSVHGALLELLSNKTSSTPEDIIAHTNNMIDYLLRG